MNAHWEPVDEAEHIVMESMLSAASEYGLETEVMWEYVAHRQNGHDPDTAAIYALYAWDL